MKMSTASTTTDVENNSNNQNDNVQIEEWAIRYRELEDNANNSLQGQQQQEGINDDKDTASMLLVSKAMIARAGRLGALQLQQHQQGEDEDEDENENDPRILSSRRALLYQTRHEMTNDALQHHTDRVLLETTTRRLLSSAPQAVVDTCRQEQTTDVDAFFEEYPECIRSGWADKMTLGDDGDDSDDEDSGSGSADDDEDTENHHRRLHIQGNGNGNAAATKKADTRRNSKKPKQHQQHQPLHQAMEAQERQKNNPQQQQQQQPRPPTSAQGGRPANPYQKQTTSQQQQQQHPAAPRNPTTANPPPPNFEYPSDRNFIASGWSNGHSTAPPPPARATHPQHQQQWPTASHASASSWEEHANQQNPFFTAREMAQSMANDEPPRHAAAAANHHHPNHNSNNNNNNMYSNYHQPPPMHGFNNTPDEVAGTRGGPSIPDSLRRKFQPPKRGAESTNSNNNTNQNQNNRKPSGMAPSKGGGVQSVNRPSSSSGRNNNNSNSDEEEELPEELQHLDKELVKKIQNEIMEAGDSVTFDDIAGLADAKQTVQEVVCWPMKRPDLFTGLRRAPNGLLLYGPPGTGKTLIGKAIAHESGATFFSISSSSLTSKWIGEGEKLVKTLFAVAGYREPAVVFIDEIDSLLTQRKSTENEASRRIKTEFLVQLDGTGTSGQGRVLVIGATNKPQELDEAARRRFTKRLYIPLPVQLDRRILLHVMLKKNNHQLTEQDIDRLAKDTEGFSGADLKSLCTDAAMGPIRQLGPRALEVNVQDVPPITYKHFKRSLKGTKPSVAPSDLVQYEEWDSIYGTKRATEEEDDDDDDDDD